MLFSKTHSTAVPIESVEVSTYRVPTEEPESDGTYQWDGTNVVVVEAAGGGRRGLGYAYAPKGAAEIVAGLLRSAVCGQDVMNLPQCWMAMMRSVREATRPGIATEALSAVDAALWDLKAHVLELPLASLLGMARDAVSVYGSGGFTSESIDELQRQLSGWVEQGISRVKMKVGRAPAEDLRRVKAAREAIGTEPELFVDANGAYSRKQALAFAERFVEYGVTWFEEPVSSDDLDGLRLLRNRAPATMEVSAGEYGYDLFYFRRMLEADAVDVLQADARRCGGVTGWLKVGTLCEAASIPLSSHTAPSLHLPVACAVQRVRHMEYFADHVRIERLLFEGARLPQDGMLAPDLTRPGLGLELKRADAERYAT